MQTVENIVLRFYTVPCTFIFTITLANLQDRMEAINAVMK